jgi:RimJ/RimL family protein N-acetyltransferase
MRETIFETERLTVTSLQQSDIEPLWRGCFSDWEVMRLLLGQTFSLEEATEYIHKTFSKGQLFDFTVVFEKESNELIGYAGMFPYPFNSKENEYEFGYILKQEAWGKGYATELSFAQIKKGSPTSFC